MPTSLQSLLQHPAIWRPGAKASNKQVISSGYSELDESLPGGGWPFPALIEVLCERWGLGEISLALPALIRSCSAEPGEKGRTIAWLNPPHLPYPPALAARGLKPEQQWMTPPLSPAQTLWAMEQALRSAAFGAVLAWIDKVDMRSLRRLKLACEAGVCLGFLFRTLSFRSQASPATVRLALSAAAEGLSVEIVKVQGGRPRRVRIPVAR